MPRRTPDPLARVREICLSLPDSEEKIAWGAPTFRVKGRIFAMFTDDHHGDGRLALWCAAPRGMQAGLVKANTRHYFVPPYVGYRGWIGVHLDRRLAWDEIAHVIEEAYVTVAPKRLVGQARKAT